MQRKKPSKRTGATTDSSSRVLLRRSIMQFWMQHWRQLVIFAGSLGFFAGLYLIRLSSLLPAGPTELHSLADARNADTLANNPLLLPYKLLAFLLVRLPGNDLFQARLAAVAVTAATIALVYYVARRWYGQVNAIWLAWLFAASSWLLQTGRFGSPVCALGLTVAATIAACAWLRGASGPGRALLGFAGALALCLLTPGGIWLAIAAVLVVYPQLVEKRQAVRPADLATAAAILSCSAVLVAVAAIRSPHVLSQWVGLPSSLPGLTTIGKQAVGSISYLVARGPVWPELWLAHTPLLDVATSLFLLLGSWFYLRHLNNARSRLLLFFGVIGVILTALNGVAALGLLIPVVYLLVGGGMAYFMHQWHRVFPRNPLARGLASSLIIVLLLCIIGFHTSRSFVAWRRNADTQAAYHTGHTTDPPNLLQ